MNRRDLVRDLVLAIALTLGLVASIRAFSHPSIPALHVIEQPDGGRRYGNAYPYVDLSGAQTVLANPPLGHAKGGTDVTSTGATGNALVSNAGNWISAQVAYANVSGTPTLPTVAGGTDISVTGGPAYTVALAAGAGTGFQVYSNPSNVGTWEGVAGDLTLPSYASGNANFKVVGIQSNSVPAPSGTNTFLEWTGSALTWVKGNVVSGFASSSMSITTTLTTCTSITIAVASGQTAHLWGHAWIEDADTNPHQFVMGLVGLAVGEATTPILGSGLSSQDVNISGMITDTVVGTNTYTLQLRRIDSNAVVTGTVTSPYCDIQGIVTTP